MPTLESPEIPGSPESLEALVARLREANQNLVIASLRAQELQDQTEARNERQKEFLAMLAHELRNPLAPIVMAGEMLEKISAAHPQLPYIQQLIVRQASHMTRLLDDLLDASRVSSGKITLQKSRLLLGDVVQSAAEISRPFLDQHAQTLSVELPSSPVVLQGDAVRLAQVFSNLLINASKYGSPHQSITLSAGLGMDGTVAISVKDHGLGIEPHVQPFIFDLFTQAPRPLDRSQGGLGIGLSLVRSLVELHGGTVQVRSQGLGCGSEFIVVLPVCGEPAVPEPSPAAPAQATHPCRTLVIEDNVDANEALNWCLTFMGHTVASAFDGPSGLAMAKAGGYDLIICDIGLPGMDGYEVLRQIRQLSLVPVPYCIAMSGYDQPSYRTHALAVGFDHYLVKPVSVNALQDVISKAFPAAAMTR